MSIDPIFWDFIGASENKSAPLSFRFLGAWTCPAPALAQVDVDESDAVDLIAKRLLGIADEQLGVISGWSLDDFVQLCCEQRSEGPDGFLPCVVTTLIAMGRKDEALEACVAAQQVGAFNGFLGPGGSFVEMASRWLQQSIAATTRH